MSMSMQKHTFFFSSILIIDYHLNKMRVYEKLGSRSHYFFFLTLISKSTSINYNLYEKKI